MAPPGEYLAQGTSSLKLHLTMALFLHCLECFCLALYVCVEISILYCTLWVEYTVPHSLLPLDAATIGMRPQEGCSEGNVALRLKGACPPCPT